MFRTIKFRFTISYLLLVTMVSLSFIFLFTSISSRRIADSTLDNITLIIEKHADDIDQQINNHADILHMLNTFEGFDPRDQAKAKLCYEAVINLDSILFENIVYTNNLGISTSYYKEPLSELNTDFINHVLDSDEAFYVSDPTISLISRNPIILIGIPYQYNEDHIGVLSGSINLDKLSSFINEYSFHPLSFSWIVDNQGRFIAHRDFDLASSIYDLGTEAYYTDFDELQTSLENDETGYGSYQLAETGEEYSVIFTSVPHTNGWKTGITIPYSYLFRNEEMTTTLLFTMSVIILILTLVSTLVLTNRITKPIVDLTTAIASRKVVPDHKIKKHGSNKEIKHLVAAYNRMTVELYDHMNNLETMVKARTKDLESANEKLYKMATVDKLTGVVNRSQLDDIITQYKYDVDNYQLTGFSILFIDINNFKYYNDRFGHDVGDQILKRFSNFFMNHSRESDTVGRYGGDEFIIVLPKVSMATAEIIRENLSEAFKGLDYFIPELSEWLGDEVDIPRHQHLGIAIGIGHYIRNSKTSIDELYLEADQDMYQMKNRMKENKNI